MGKFRKKPVVIEAEKYSVGLEDGFVTMGEAITAGCHVETYKQPACADFRGVPFIATLEGKHFISEGDWIITGVQGERYPCKPDIFEATYEPVEEGIDGGAREAEAEEGEPNTAHAGPS